MKLEIVGVGQTYNFETRQMEDTLQVRTPDGSSISVPTTNEAAHMLIKLQNGSPAEAIPTSLPPSRPAAPPVADVGEFPAGAEVFGGAEDPAGLADSPAFDPENVEMADAVMEAAGLAADMEVEQQIFQKTKQTGPTNAKSLGLRRNPADRSGVPSYGISRVDEKGNPVLAAAPDFESDDDEDDDPGEQA